MHTTSHANATHPSDHSVDLGRDPEAATKLWKANLQKREKETIMAISGSKNPDPWISLQIERNSERVKDEFHPRAFLEPGDLPYYAYWGEESV